MTTNFTVILFQRQHFGNEPGTFNDIEPNVPFAGRQKTSRSIAQALIRAKPPS